MATVSDLDTLARLEGGFDSLEVLFDDFAVDRVVFLEVLLDVQFSQNQSPSGIADNPKSSR